MTKKDFELIANAIKDDKATWSKEADQAQRALTSLAHTLAIRLKLQNPRFDSSRFLSACGINQ